MFMHLVGFVGNLVHSSASGPRNVDNTIFHARVGSERIPQKAYWDTLCQTCVFASSGIYGSRRAFWCVQVAKHRHTIFDARVGLVHIPQKSPQDTLRRTCVFASSGICGSRSVFQCVWTTKCRQTIFHAWVGPIRIQQKARL
jgi:hypothetical protein